MRIIIFTIITFGLFYAAAYDSQAAFVKTKYGVIEGNVIVRQFDEIVVTVNTKDRRLFQYYAGDIISVTAPTKVLAGTAVFLREEPSDSALPTVELATGCQVDFTKDGPKDDWVKVKTWGDNVGWIPFNILTDSVEFKFQPFNGAEKEQDKQSDNLQPQAVKNE